MTTEPEDDDRIISIGGPLFEPVPEKFYELLRELERVESAPPVFVTPEMIDWAATEIATALGDPSEWQRYRLCAELALHRVAPMFAERFGARGSGRDPQVCDGVRAKRLRGASGRD